MQQRKSLADRFNDRFEPEPNSGCWLWTALRSYWRNVEKRRAAMRAYYQAKKNGEK